MNPCGLVCATRRPQGEQWTLGPTLAAQRGCTRHLWSSGRQRHPPMPPNPGIGDAERPGSRVTGRLPAMELPFDRGTRRRVYLMRHAEAAYLDVDGRIARDPRAVPLTAHGRREAAAMGALLAPAHFDRAVCSGLPRTVETAEIVLADKRLPLERVPELEEVRGGPRGPGIAVSARDVAYSIWEAERPDGRVLGGAGYAELHKRGTGAPERSVAPPARRRVLLRGPRGRDPG